MMYKVDLASQPHRRGTEAQRSTRIWLPLYCGGGSSLYSIAGLLRVASYCGETARPSDWYLTWSYITSVAFL